MSYLVLARKYRPQSFAEMAGQEHVVRTLTNALASGHLAHAFLFTGPRGVGKTTSARLVAKCLNCAQGPTATPCGVCTPCVEIAEGRAVDVVEIDAASNNGVDNVRDIVEAVKYRPARDRFKVFVIDEVHMLSTGAFNALLKTLEEPPPHVKFVLATTDVHKVPETIVSRCQRFDFRRLTRQQIVATLRRVADAEGLHVSDAALALVARTAEGGMRDALSMLDQVRAACGDRADDAAVAEAVGAVDPGAISRIGAALVRRDGAAVLDEIDALYGRGAELKRVAEELTRHLRNVVVAKLVPDRPLDLPDTERDEVRAQADGASPAQLTRLFDLAQAAVKEIKESEAPRYALEVALLEACLLAPGAEVSELLARLDTLGGGRGPAGAEPRPPRAAARPAPAGGATTGTEPASRASAPAASPVPLTGGTPGCAAGAPPTSPPPPGFEVAPPAAAQPAAATDVPDAPLEERWRRFVAEVGQSSSALANALKQAAVLGLGGGELALRLPPGMAFSTVERKRAEVEAHAARFFGGAYRVALTAGAAPAPGDAPAEAALPRSLAEVEVAEKRARAARVRAAAEAHPRIQEAKRILDVESTRIEEL